MATRHIPRLGFCAPGTLVLTFCLGACSISINSPNPDASAGGVGGAGIGSGGLPSTGSGGGSTGGTKTSSGGTTAASTGSGGRSAGGTSASSGGTTSSSGGTTTSTSSGGAATTSAGSGGTSSTGLGGTGTTTIGIGGVMANGGGAGLATAGAAAMAGNAGVGVAGASSKNLVWSVAALVETRTEAAAAPKIAQDPSGNAMAVWVQSDGNAQSIYTNTYTAGSGWGTATLLETSAMPADSPQIVADATGDYTAVWRQAWKVVNGERYGVYASHYVPAAGWGAIAAVYAETTNDSVTANGDLQLASDPNGNAIVTFSVYDWSWNHNSVRANRYAVATGWGGVTNLSTEAVQNAAGADVAIDATGNAIVVFEQSAGTTASVQGIQAVRYAAGTGWGTPALIESATVAATRGGSGPQVAFDASGNATVVWYQYSKPGIYANRWSGAAGWGTPVAMTDPGTVSYDEGVTLAIDKNGNAMAVWNQYGGVLYANRYVSGVSWGTTVIADAGSADYSSKVAFYPNGNALTVWAQYSRNSYNIWANNYAIDSGWATAVWEQSIVNKTLDYASDPQLVIDKNGTALVVWVQNSNIYAATAGAP
jgi:hypothetical protein